MAAVPASVTEAPIKVPAHNVPAKTEPWKANREGESLWAGDIDGKIAFCLLTVLVFHQVTITFVIITSVVGGDSCRSKVHF